MVDVSDYQGVVDWPAVSAAGMGIGGAICKATEDYAFVAGSFSRNWQGIHDAGLVRGAYHFARPTPGQAHAVQEADHFLFALEHAGGWEPGDLLVLDLEAGVGNLREWALFWLRRVQLRTGITPMIYSRSNFLELRGCTGSPELAQYPLWLASYRDSADLSGAPAPPAGWTAAQVKLWQYTDNGAVPGIAGPVDLSLVLA